MANDGLKEHKTEENPNGRNLSELLSDEELNRRLEGSYKRELQYRKEGKESYLGSPWWHLSYRG